MIAVYPGSFDPATKGHLDIIYRASKITDKLYVAVLANPSKNSLFSVEERIVHLKEITKGLDGIEVISFGGLLVDFTKKVKAQIVIRGLRAMTDFEYEFQMALTNRALNAEIETLFIPTSVNYLYLSSSVVKEVAMFGGDFEDMVPDVVYKALREKFGQAR